MRIWVLGLAALLGSCTSRDQREAEQAKALVAAKLKDPESAKFTDVRMFLGTTCGMVNGKNSFGAYSGAEKFIGSRLRSDSENLEAMLSNTPAGKEYHAIDEFDKSWAKCQGEGAPVK